MSRTRILLGISALALAACQPAENAADALQAEPAPVAAEQPVTEDVATEDTADLPEDTVIETDEAPETVDTSSPEESDHDHAGEDHADEADADDHDHDHAGGEAHVHGKSEMAVSLDGNSVAVSLEGALANFDLDESVREISDPARFTSGVLELRGGGCSTDMASAFIRPIGDHGNMMLDFMYTCAAIEDLSGIDVTAFSKFAGFEEVDAVILTATGQTAQTLTRSDTVLDLP